MTMTLTPTSWKELAAALQAAGREGATVETVNLTRLGRIQRYAPEDLTVTVEAGITLDALQAELRRHGQWLPIDPPDAGTLSVAEILDRNLSGPRRHGYGTLREHLLGVRVALADGRIIRSGGEVVKNVAGYDLMKLFVGAGRSLGVIVEAAFKLQPVPAQESIVSRTCASWDDAARSIELIRESPVTPVIFDLHNIGQRSGQATVLVLGFAGSTEEVEWQLAQARTLGFVDVGSLAYSETFAGSENEAAPRQCWSVLPSRLIQSLRALGPASFVARAGLGIIEHNQPKPPSDDAATPGPTALALMQRVKATFDPAGVLPPLPVHAR